MFDKNSNEKLNFERLLEKLLKIEPSEITPFSTTISSISGGDALSSTPGGVYGDIVCICSNKEEASLTYSQNTGINYLAIKTAKKDDEERKAQTSERLSREEK